MTPSGSSIKVTVPIIAAKVRDRPFTVRDVPGIPPQTLRGLSRCGYLILVRKAQAKGGGMKNYYPAIYRLNVASKRVQDLLREAAAS
ncbi:MAG: hypothetical protein O0X93_01650 [Methanocorpusculum sp.]|nr:hypothetical protein [Methanocorpusculum sp.]MDE2521849.1 hypothetical protein [Methanocorpusculum sp.]MDE2524842.1 hypothetical protein [Methanocorpusculum sp.]